MVGSRSSFLLDGDATTRSVTYGKDSIDASHLFRRLSDSRSDYSESESSIGSWGQASFLLDGDATARATAAYLFVSLGGFLSLRAQD
eukprot:200214-Prorocentrum_minimum.AAC.1